MGGTAFAETPGTASALSQGWANVIASGKIGVLAIFTQAVPGRPDSEGTVAGLPSTNHVTLPFDNTQGYATGVAVANTNATSALLITLTFQTDTGAVSTGSLRAGPRMRTRLSSDQPRVLGDAAYLQVVSVGRPGVIALVRRLVDIAGVAGVDSGRAARASPEPSFTASGSNGWMPNEM